MATTRVISITSQLNERLKQENNASALIVKLLMGHYEMEETKKMPQKERMIYLKRVIDRHKMVEKHKKQLERFDK